MGDDLTLRRAGPDDTEPLCALIGEVFPDNPKADPEVLRWQFWDNPFGQAVSWIAEDDGRFVGHFAVLPVPATIQGQRARLAKPADAATLPEAQGQGLMGRLARAVFADCADEDIPFTMCLPNFRARGALKKIGMEEVARLRAFVRPLDDRWLAERFRVPAPVAGGIRRLGFRSPGDPAGERVDGPPDGLDDLVARTTAAGRTGVVHDSAWWRWRYVDAPADYRYFALERRGRLVAVAVTRVREGYGARFVFLLDLVAEDEDAARAVVARASVDRGDAVGLATLALPRSRVASLARACGLRMLPTRLEPQPAILGIVRNAADAAAPSAESWDISWCELDHV